MLAREALSALLPRLRHAQRTMPSVASLQLRLGSCGTDDAGSAAKATGLEPPRITQDLQAKTEKELMQLIENNKALRESAVDTVSPESTEVEEGRDGEFGGPKGAEPTRFGDWERKGRCTDF